MSLLGEMRVLLEGFVGKQYKVNAPDTLVLPDLKLKPGDIFRISGRGGSLLTATRVSDNAQSSISTRFLQRVIDLAQIDEIK